MRATSLLSALILIISISACHQTEKAKPVDEKAELPEALDDSKKDVVSFKRYPSGNLIDAIYINLVKKTPDLQNLEDQLQKFNEGKADSLQAFNNYVSKIESYYGSANQDIENIGDSVLKARLKVLFAAEKGRYKLIANKFKILINDTDNENMVMKDYYETLKLVSTLPVIVKYQNNNTPDIKSVKAINYEAKLLKAKTVKLVKKYGGASVVEN